MNGTRLKMVSLWKGPALQTGPEYQFPDGGLLRYHTWEGDGLYGLDADGAVYAHVCHVKDWGTGREYRWLKLGMEVVA